TKRLKDPGDAANAFELLGAKILTALDRPDGATLLVTGSRRGDGATTVALSLAASFAQTGKRVILVDANLAKPALHALLKVKNRSGLSSFLTDSVTASDH